MQSIRNFNLTCNFLGNPKSWSYKAKALRYSGGRVSFCNQRSRKITVCPQIHYFINAISEAVHWGASVGSF